MAVALSLLVIVGTVYAIWHMNNRGETEEVSATTTPEIATDVPHYIGNFTVVRGTVTEADGDEITVDGTHTITVDDNTEVYRRGAEKSIAVYQREFDEFLRKIENANKNPDVTYIAPDNFEHEAILLSEIKVGETVHVTPAKIEGDTFVALSILVGEDASMQ